MGNLNFIVLTGRFAAGKDTQAAILIKKLGEESSEIISTGDVYRSAKSGEGEYSRFHHYVAPFIEDIDVKMRLLPDDVMTQIVQEVISEKVAKGIENFIFTGFPRTLGQLEYYDKMILNFSKESEVKNVFIEYRVSDETTLERSRKRRSDTESRGEVSRPWDSDEGVAKRISTYYREIEPMIEKLRNEERLFTIEAEKTIPEVEAETSIRLSKERF